MYTIKEIKTAIANCNTTVEVQKAANLIIEYGDQPLTTAFKVWLGFVCWNRKKQILTA